MSTSETNKNLVRQFFSALNSGDAEALVYGSCWLDGDQVSGAVISKCYYAEYVGEAHCDDVCFHHCDDDTSALNSCYVMCTIWGRSDPGDVWPSGANCAVTGEGLGVNTGEPL